MADDWTSHGRGNGKTNKMMTEKQAEIALAICNSESFMWLMVGSNHQELQLKNLRPAWSAFLEAGGGWGKR